MPKAGWSVCRRYALENLMGLVVEECGQTAEQIPDVRGVNIRHSALGTGDSV